MSQVDLSDNTARVIESLKSKLIELREKAVKRVCYLLENDLLKENEQLRLEIQQKKRLVIEREIENGRPQFYIPLDLRVAPATPVKAVDHKLAADDSKASKANVQALQTPKAENAKQANSAKRPADHAKQADSAKKPADQAKQADSTKKSAKPDGEKQPKADNGKQQADSAKQSAKSDKPAKQPEAQKAAKGSEKVEKQQRGTSSAAAAVTEQPADIRRVNLRIGRIVEVSKHPEADSLYVERVDVGDGDGRLRTVVSGLVKYMREDELRGRLAIFMTNLKPAKLRGILSEGMIMCASNEDKSQLEVLTIPPGCEPGDRVFATGYEDGEPDEELNPKRKIWEDFVKPVLRTNADGIASYRDAPLHVRGREGVVRSNVKNAQIS